MKHLKVEGHNNLLRDSETGAIINSDKSGFSSYMMNKNIKMKRVLGYRMLSEILLVFIVKSLS